MIYTTDQASILEYDLNVFYEDLGHDNNGVNQWSDVYTIQPSAYVLIRETSASFRIYLESFKLTLAETRAIAPDFPENEWGDDFFIGLEHFIDTCKSLPETVKAKLNNLPDLETIKLDTDAPELKWLARA